MLNFPEAELLERNKRPNDQQRTGVSRAVYMALTTRLRVRLRCYSQHYFRAFDGLVTPSAAGYEYRGNWASSPGRIFTYWNTNLASLQPEARSK